MKNCRRCGELKSLDNFNRNCAMKDGRLNTCKSCRHSYAAAYYAADRGRQKAAAAGWRAKNRTRKLEHDAAYRARPENRERQRSYNREYYKQNCERLKAAAAAWSARNYERKRAIDSEYRASNRETLRAWHRQYRADNPDLFAWRGRQKHHARRALKLACAHAQFTQDQLRDKFSYWNDSCWVCGDLATAVDHVKPLAAGGPHMLCNLRPICLVCNSAKNSRWPLRSRAEIMGII
jgi:5-methylcytosine-specific restriction endonuclease McrA